MNGTTLLAVALALILVAPWCKRSKAVDPHSWACVIVAILLLIEPAKALLGWAQSFFKL